MIRVPQNAVTIKDLSFEWVCNFKYLGVDVNLQSDSHEEIFRRMTTEYKCYFSLVKLFKSKMLSKRTQIRLYKALVRPIVLYACDAWASTKSDENNLLISEREISRRIFGLKRVNKAVMKYG